MSRKAIIGGNFEMEDVDMANLDDEAKAQMIQQQVMIENMQSDKNERATN